jgi:hypothetical protein
LGCCCSSSGASTAVGVRNSELDGVDGVITSVRGRLAARRNACTQLARMLAVKADTTTFLSSQGCEKNIKLYFGIKIIVKIAYHYFKSVISGHLNFSHFLHHAEVNDPVQNSIVFSAGVTIVHQGRAPQNKPMLDPFLQIYSDCMNK